MNTAYKIYLTQLVQLAITLIQAITLILIIYNIIPNTLIHTIITITTMTMAIIVTGYSFDIEHEYYAILDDLKHKREEKPTEE